MLTYLSIFMLGAAGRAAGLALDAEARLVMADHWHLDWSGMRHGGWRGRRGWSLD